MSDEDKKMNDYPELKAPDCIDCTPTKLDPRIIPASYRNHARALLLSLGEDPNPANLSRLIFNGIKLGGVHIPLGYSSYLIYNENEIYIMLENLILQNPLSIPSKFLAIIIAGSIRPSIVDSDFRHVIQIAENFKENPTFESLFTLRAMIEADKFLNSHLNEILLHDFDTKDNALLSISKSLGFTDFKSQLYKGEMFFIFEFDPFDFPSLLLNPYSTCSQDQTDQTDQQDTEVVK